MFLSPVAEDRGGVEEDFENYVNFLARLRKRLNSSGRKYGLTLTLVCSLSSNIPAIHLTLSPQPASYWYLKGFDIVNMEKHLDWFNMMTYDIRKSLCDVK